jgi:diguanylate cyclase (GGDEF)-like protein
LHGHPLLVRTFTDASEAIVAMGSTDVAVVVSDFRMPAMNGVELLTRAAELQPSASRILLTGYADLQTAMEAINRGAVSRFLTKPWTEGEFEDTILEQAALSTLDRLLAALPSFQTQVLALRDAAAIDDALVCFVRETAGLGIQIANGEAAENVFVEAAGRAVTLAMAPSHIAVFRSAKLLGRLRDLLAIAARSALLAASGRLLEQELVRLSDVDGLSGVLNRRAFDRELVREVDRARRYSSQLSLMLIDIDRFKSINDTFGHQVGDSVIKALGQVLRDITRSTDVAARYGGDEFSVILPGLDQPQAAGAARRIRKAVASMPPPAEGSGRLTLSIGVATWAAGVDVAALLGLADQGVYRVKEAGRDGVAFSGTDEIMRDPPEEAS